MLLLSIAPAFADNTITSLSDDEQAYVDENLHILFDEGILKGYPDGDFDGENQVTRYEMGVALTRFYVNLLDEINDAGIDLMEFVDIRSPVDGPIDMGDIPENHWAYNEILRLEHMGVATGYPDWTYQGTNKVKRYEFSVFLLRVVVLVDFGLWEAVPGYDGGFRHAQNITPERLTDVPEEHWAQRDVHRLLLVGDISLASDGTLEGEMTFTRNEMALVLLKLRERFIEELEKISKI
jgi:hypothetical protein